MPPVRPFLPAAAVAAALLGLAALDAPLTGQEGGSSQDGPRGADRLDRDGVPDLPGVDETAKGAEAGQDQYPRRLPAGYGAVGLSREQKERVYAIQAKYDGRIQELLDEIARVKNKQDAEIAEVLTPGQRQFLDEWRAARDAERDARDRGDDGDDRDEPIGEAETVDVIDPLDDNVPDEN